MARLDAHWAGDGDGTLFLNAATWGWDDLVEIVELVELMVSGAVEPVSIVFQVGALRGAPGPAASGPLVRLAELPVRRITLTGDLQVTGHLAAALEVMLPEQVVVNRDTNRAGSFQAA